MRIAAPLALTFALAASAAQAAPSDTLTTPPALAARLAERDLVILHAGSEANFAAGHIPGARLASRDALSVTGPAAGGLILELPPEAELRAQLQALGVGDRSRIVVYAAAGEVQPATRLMWTLDAAGLGERAVLLDGGLAAWKAAGRPVETGPAAAPAPGRLSPLKMAPRRVTTEQVAARADGLKLIDARAPVFYDGLQPGFGAAPEKKGHIPGAVSVPFTSVTGPDQRFRSPAELRAIFARAGVKPGDKVAVYCHVGQQATAVQFAAQRAGVDARLYDGSFQDWARGGRPVETTPAGPAK